MAALRDSLSANRSGIVWVDDLNDLEKHDELLRQVTVGGTLTKKGEDNYGQMSAQMRASLVISGEGLGLHGQKALMDRSVLLSVPSPTNRLSKAGGGRLQWEDIQDLRDRYPDLTVFAGSIVQLALGQTGVVPDIKKYREGRGRHADKMAVLRLGARILYEMSDAMWVVDQVDSWIANQKDTGNENALTLTLVPKALALTGFKDRPDGPDEMRKITATPVFVDRTNTVWFSPKLLALWIERNSGRMAVRLETEQALTDQARVLGLGGVKGEDRKQVKFASNNGRAVYWRLTPELSREVLGRAEGGVIEEEEVSEPDSLIQ
jgi:hypothetical protein